MTHTTKVVRALAATLAVALAAACQKTETPEQARTRMQQEADAARPLITTQLARYVRAAAMGNQDSMMLLYTNDAVLLPPERPAIVGHDSVRADFQRVGRYRITFATRSLTVNGDVAIERGIWQATMAGSGSFAVQRNGKYLTHWHKVDGQWLMAEQMWSDDYPMVM